jgi:hypothetical protein
MSNKRTKSKKPEQNEEKFCTKSREQKFTARYPVFKRSVYRIFRTVLANRVQSPIPHSSLCKLTVFALHNFSDLLCVFHPILFSGRRLDSFPLYNISQSKSVPTPRRPIILPDF